MRRQGGRGRDIFVKAEPPQGPTAEGFSPDYLLALGPGAQPKEALTDPPAVPARSLGLPDGTLILGVASETEARAYPVASIYFHHVVNDWLSGTPLAVTFCRRCFAGVAFDPVVDGRRLTFNVFGMYQGNAALQDTQTGTVWGQLSGVGLVGILAGHRLPLVPIFLTTLADWLRLHPDSLAPRPDLLMPGPPRLPGEFRMGPGRKSVSHWDERLPSGTFVLGVETPGSTVAYALDPHQPGPRLYQDEVSGIPIVLLASPGAWPLAYDRRIEETVLEFRLDRDRLVDASGTVWTGEGRAIEGPLRGAMLEYVRSVCTYWYAWAAYHPETEIRRF